MKLDIQDYSCIIIKEFFFVHSCIMYIQSLALFMYVYASCNYVHHVKWYYLPVYTCQFDVKEGCGKIQAYACIN